MRLKLSKNGKIIKILVFSLLWSNLPKTTGLRGRKGHFKLPFAILTEWLSDKFTYCVVLPKTRPGLGWGKFEKNWGKFRKVFLVNSGKSVVNIEYQYYQQSTHLKGRLGPPVGHVFELLKGFCRFPVSGHFSYPLTLLPYSRLFGAPCGSHFWVTQRILSFYCFWTLSVFSDPHGVFKVV